VRLCYLKSRGTASSFARLVLDSPAPRLRPRILLMPHFGALGSALHRLAGQIRKSHHLSGTLVGQSGGVIRGQQTRYFGATHEYLTLTLQNTQVSHG